MSFSIGQRVRLLTDKSFGTSGEQFIKAGSKGTVKVDAPTMDASYVEFDKYMGEKKLIPNDQLSMA